jgi:peptidoglycan hydrolase CwlO-like protein
LHDSDFKFESVLIALRIAIESNGIVVGDKKRTKILTTISSFLNDHYLQDWAAKYSQLKTEADNLKKQLQGFEVLSQIQSLEKKKEELDKLKVNLQKKKEKIQKKIEKIETENLFSQLSEGLAQLGISLASEVKAEVNPQN